jgi:hypothetical protein
MRELKSGTLVRCIRPSDKASAPPGVSQSVSPGDLALVTSWRGTQYKLMFLPEGDVSRGWWANFELYWEIVEEPRDEAADV